MNKCVFLDRDGILNEEIGGYVYAVCNFTIRAGIIDILKHYKAQGFLLIVITNQGGIARGLYTAEEVKLCHGHFQKESGNAIDALYFSPYQPSFSASLSAKPGSLMFEKAIAKYNIDPEKSWMIGDRERDIIPAKRLGIKTIRVLDETESVENTADYTIKELVEIRNIIH